MKQYTGSEITALRPGAARADERFVVGETLGAGAAGVVYRAYDTVRRHDVALKILSHLHPDVLYSFKREFRSQSDLIHPNLVTLYALHHEDTSWALAMELVEGARSYLDYVRPYRHLLDGAPDGPSSVAAAAGTPAPALRTAGLGELTVTMARPPGC